MQTAMKLYGLFGIACLSAALTISSCAKSERRTSGWDVKFEDWPLTDCSTSTRPVRDLVAYKVLGVPYKWEEDWLSGTRHISLSPTLMERSHLSHTKIIWKRIFVVGLMERMRTLSSLRQT